MITSKNGRFIQKGKTLVLLLSYIVFSSLFFWHIFTISIVAVATFALLSGGLAVLTGHLLLIPNTKEDSEATLGDTNSTVADKEFAPSITSAMESENLLLQSKLNECLLREHQFQALMEKLQIGLLLFENNALHYTNPFFLNHFDFRADEILHKGEKDIFSQNFAIHQEGNSAGDGYIFFNFNSEKEIQYKVKRTIISPSVYALIISEKEPAYKVNIKKHKLEVIGQLANGVAHDFNNILAGIIGAVEILEEDLEEEKIKYTTLIRDSANRATDLTHKILSFSQKEYNKSTAFDLHDIILSTISILKRTINKKIKITNQLEASTATILGNKSIVQNILINMSLNSEAAMPNGGELNFSTKIISYSKKECFEKGSNLKPGTYIEVSVLDTGLGIPKDELEKIFDPFFSGNGNDSNVGLGLTNAYKDVLSMGGEISVTSTPNVKTVFNITLPLETEKKVARKTILPPIIKNKNILIVDDEEIIVLTAKTILENAGFTILSANNGFEAIELYKNNHIDLVLMDMIMPELDGKECFRALKNIDEEVRVVLMTGFAREKDVTTMKREGLMDIITKPFDPTDLVNLVATLSE